MDTDGTEPNETAALEATVGATEPAATASSGTGGLAPFRLRLGVGWRLARHLLGMVVAMMVGMAVLDVAIGALGEPPGYTNPLVEHGLMGASMSASMVGWMRYRGHGWSDGLEMTAAMLVPMLALVLAAELGAAGRGPGPPDHSLTMLSHAAMIFGMAALMVCRRDRYAHGVRG